MPMSLLPRFQDYAETVLLVDGEWVEDGAASLRDLEWHGYVHTGTAAIQHPRYTHRLTFEHPQGEGQRVVLARER